MYSRLGEAVQFLSLVITDEFVYYRLGDAAQFLPVFLTDEFGHLLAFIVQVVAQV